MGQAARRQEGAALARPEERARLIGTYHGADEIDRRLQAARERYHLVSPFTSMGEPPEGICVQLALVQVDPDTEAYNLGGGKFALLKRALDAIAAALGLSWPPGMSGRLDNGRHPHYCHFRAVASYKGPDGRDVYLTQEKEVDLRDGSPQIASKSPKQIAQMREHILSNAESKAQNRIVRKFVGQHYSRADLAKPFAVAKVVFNERLLSDPESRREATRMRAASFFGATAALYGTPATLPTVLPRSRDSHALPPVGSVGVDEDDFEDVIDAPAESAPAEPPRQRRSAPQPGGEVPVMKFGRSKGVPITEADDGDLEWYAGAIRRSVEDPEKSRFREANQRELDAVEHELARRRGEDEEPPADEGDFGDDSWPEDA